MLDVKRLRVLQELSRRETVTETARALGYTPSAVSQQLSALARECGVPLVQRQGRALVLTPQARTLIEHTERILHEMDLAVTALQSTQDEPAGRVRLAIFQTAASALLPRALDLLARRHPLVRVHVVQREPEAALAQTQLREVDLVVAEQYPHHAVAQFPEVDSRRLLRDPVRLAVPGGSDVASPAQAAHLPWAMEPAGNASRDWALHVCRSAGFEPEVRFEFDDVRAHADLVAAGHAVSLLPWLACVNAPAGIRWVPLPGDPHREVFTSARRDMAPRPAIEAVRSCLHDAAEALVPSHHAR